MKKFPVALQLYSVRDQMAKDFEGTLDSVAKMGYDGVEFAGLFSKSAEQVRELCLQYHLNPISAHVPLGEMLEDPDKTFATYKEIGCSYIAVPYLGGKDRPGKENYGATVENVRMLAKKSKAYGLQMMYHNHDFEFVRLENGKYGFDDLYDQIPADLLTAEIDTCWVNVAGEDPAAYVRKYSGRIPVVHLKDFVMPGKKPAHLYALIGMKEEQNKGDSDAFSFRPVGYGAQNIPEILRASEEAESVWLVVEQDDPSLGKTSLECAAMSIGYLKSLWS